MKRVIRVVVRLKGRSALAKMDLARYVVSKMTGNMNFTVLAAQVTLLKDAADALESAITAANTRDTEAIGLKDLAAETVADLLAKLCDSINGIAAGDMVKLLTCGLPLRRENEPIGELPPPIKLVSNLTKTSGRAALVFEGPNGAHNFNIYMSKSDSPFTWELIGVTTKQRYNADSLEPGKFYWFSVSAVGTAGESSKSEPARAMAAA